MKSPPFVFFLSFSFSFVSVYLSIYLSISSLCFIFSFLLHLFYIFLGVPTVFFFHIIYFIFPTSIIFLINFLIIDFLLGMSSIFLPFFIHSFRPFFFHLFIQIHLSYFPIIFFYFLPSNSVFFNPVQRLLSFFLFFISISSLVFPFFSTTFLTSVIVINCLPSTDFTLPNSCEYPLFHFKTFPFFCHFPYFI
ncbi:unnamed protein product [Acanthosepion pharaonis]|uniref:Uncharacterized protein n=1 Tax=Acanthosepion pharaonis TaxID=158019 RepID=A0A812D8R8_ACAPH|nr:unnamed protein product [Sepia pharaonis]